MPTQDHIPATIQQNRAPLPDELHQSAETGLDNFVADAGDATPDPRDLPGDTHRVWACSDFVARSCSREPSLLADLVGSGDLLRRYERDTYRQMAIEALAVVDSEADLMDALRRIRRREMVRVAWRDLGGLAPLEEMLADTSALADALVDAALSHLYRWSCAELGTPEGPNGDPQALVVLGMGKLGAEELNFSSDIDLIFAFPEGGETAGARRSLTNQEFFIRLGRRLVKVLGNTTAEGIVFRVDMRLRPFGNSGPLVTSFSAMEAYYQAHGRDWERYALVRARPIAGDLAAGAELLETLRPFVYRRYLDFGAIEALRDMKELIVKEVSRKGLEDNLKLGAGGIREIEFLGQVFQMIHGGREPELRDRRITRVLGHLAQRDYLPHEAVAELIDAYHFLRTAEHRLQEVDDRQTHQVPDSPEARLRLAAGMGYADWDQFSQALDTHRSRVQAHFDSMFAPERPTRPDADDLEAMWQGYLGPEREIEVLREVGFEDAASVHQAIDRLREAPPVRHLSKRGRRRLKRLMPQLLVSVREHKGTATTVSRLCEVVEAIGRRSVYLALLVENPLALSHLTRLCNASPWITRQIAQHPLLLDELLDPRTLYSPPDAEELAADLERRLGRAGDTEQEMDALRRFKQANTLRIAAADVSNAMPLMVVSDHLTYVAETALRKVLDIAWRDMVARYGCPRCRIEGGHETPGFAVIAYGKLGGLELGYGSDLDLVFLHGSRGVGQQTDGPRSVDNATFFGRLGRRVIHILGTPTPAGVLYEVDARLRPSGASGLLVSSIEAFDIYQRESAWTWEHQALVRGRAVAGDPGLAERFYEIRRDVLCHPRDPGRLCEEVREMRERMRETLGTDTHHSNRFNLKQDRGGIADIEFMVQYAVLRWASALGPYLAHSDNIRLLEGLAAVGKISRNEADTLVGAYRRYRARAHALALQEQPAIVEKDALRDERSEVTAIWQRMMEG